MARGLLASFCALQGLGTVVMDCNRTHATHPRWTGHARFHVVWQIATVVSLAVLECVLLWYPGPLVSERFYLAAVLASLPMLGFFLALAARGRYGGTLTEPGGVPALRVRWRGRPMQVDMNLVVEVAAVITVSIVVALYRLAG